VKVRFQADADLNLDIVKGVLRREPAVDFRTAKAAGLRGLADTEVLAIAAREGRILVTHDRQTMPWEFARFVAANESPGVLIVSQNVSVSEAIEDLLLIWLASEDADWTNRIASVPL
jgi:predicted nuclease of predicted toxin-antitoxin system